MSHNSVSRLFAVAALLLVMATTLSSCRYATNRYYDLRDTFAVGAGVSAETEKSPIWPWPPSLGVYVEATEFLHLGAITHNGLTAEMEGRGAGAGKENRTRYGIGPWHASTINQDYCPENSNYFKKERTTWQKRMNERTLRGRPAKDLVHRDIPEDMRMRFLDFQRGWQHWGYIGAEVAISEPLVTRVGLMLRAGVDVSEALDLVLGIFTIDFKQDDLTHEDMIDSGKARG